MTPIRLADVTSQNLANRLRAMVARVEQDTGLSPDDPDLLVLKRIVLSVPPVPGTGSEIAAVANQAAPQAIQTQVDATDEKPQRTIRKVQTGPVHSLREDAA